MANIYECPQGCKAQGGQPIAATVRGWKKHMTRNHGGYNQDQLDAILATMAPNAEAGKAEFLAAGDVMEFPGPAKTEATAATPEKETTSIKTDAAAKRLSAKMNKFKKSIADKIPQAVNGALKDKGPEWQMTEDDRAMLSESFENCLEVLDVDFQIQPIGMVLSNPLWVLLLPILTLLLIFGMKAIENRPKESLPNDEKPVSLPN